MTKPYTVTATFHQGTAYAQVTGTSETALGAILAAFHALAVGIPHPARLHTLARDLSQHGTACHGWTTFTIVTEKEN